MSKIAKKVLVDGGVRFEFADGSEMVAKLRDLPQEIVDRLAIHGLSQKIGDSYAGANDKGWSVADCRDQALNVLNNLIDGVFNAGGGSTGGILAEAVAALTGKDLDEVREVIRAMSEDQVKALRKRVDVKAEVARIQAERAQARAASQSGGDATDLEDLF